MKMNLDIDQRKLLKIRSSKLITSDLDDKFNEYYYKKIKNNQKVITMFVDNIRQKQIDKKDIKLLHITGLSQIVEILKARELYRQKKDGYAQREKDAISKNITFDDYKEILESSLSIRIPDDDENKNMFNNLRDNFTNNAQNSIFRSQQ